MAHGLTRCRQSEREQKATNRYDKVVVAIDDLPRFETLINDCDLLAVLLCCVCDQPCDMGVLTSHLEDLSILTSDFVGHQKNGEESSLVDTSSIFNRFIQITSTEHDDDDVQPQFMSS
uniref:Uncharacterized protein n=1 Tax=Ascaris lumbricoides TaxID=6252 RepID=A0A0M3IRA9_ASCLU